MKENAKEMARIYRERKIIGLEYLGGKCAVCGTSRGLNFDHIDPSTKLGNVTAMAKSSIGKFLTELDKCQLLCVPHHKEKSKANKEHKGGHNKIVDVQHGTWRMYANKCKCDKCKQWKKDYRAGKVDARGNGLLV